MADFGSPNLMEPFYARGGALRPYPDMVEGPAGPIGSIGANQPLPVPQPRGGLSSPQGGGIAKFLSNVARGIDVVTSHPLYQRAWNGMVAGMTGDPMAGPKMMREISGKPLTLKDELDALRIKHYKETEERAAMDRQRRDEAYCVIGNPTATLQEKLQAASGIGDWPAFNALNKDQGPPKTRTIKRGDTIETQEYGPNGWTTIAQAPRLTDKAGFAITGYDENGRPLMQLGGSPISTPARSNLEKNQVDIQDTISRLDFMSRSFKPEFQQWGTKAYQKFLQAKSSMGSGLAYEEQKQLADMAEFQSSSYEMMSFLLNQLSGAAISPAEFDRLRQFLPNVGTSVFDGDDPITFKAKMERFDKAVRLALVRYEYAKQHGLDTGSIPLVEDELEKRVGRERLEAAGVKKRQTITAEEAKTMGLKSTRGY